METTVAKESANYASAPIWQVQQHELKQLW